MSYVSTSYDSIIDASRGQRPVEWARSRKHEEVVKYMEEELCRTRPRLAIARSCTNRGKLVMFDARDGKGFGFIEPQGGGDNVFVHISTLRGSRSSRESGYPLPGQRVHFASGRGGRDNRVRATNVVDALHPRVTAA